MYISKTYNVKTQPLALDIQTLARRKRQNEFIYSLLDIGRSLGA